MLDLSIATISKHKSNQIIHRLNIGSIVNLALMARRFEQPSAFENCKMARQSRWNNIEPPRDFPNWKPARPLTHEHAIDRHPRVLGKGGKGFYGDILIHKTVMPELSNLDKVRCDEF